MHHCRSTLTALALFSLFSTLVPDVAVAQATKKAAKQVNAKPAPPQFLAVPAEDGILADKLLWKGYDLAGIATAAMALREPKGEFESADDYDAKRAKLTAQSIYDSVTLQSRLALVLPELGKQSDFMVFGGAPVGYTFDADAKKLRLCWSGKEFVSGQLGRAVESTAVKDTKSTETVAQNSYGAKANMTSISGEHVAVAMSVTANRCPVEVEMDGATAQQTVQKAGAVVLGRLRSPYAEPDSLFSKATFSSPTEIFIKVKRLLFVPEQIVLLDRDTRSVIAIRDLSRP